MKKKLLIILMILLGLIGYMLFIFFKNLNTPIPINKSAEVELISPEIKKINNYEWIKAKVYSDGIVKANIDKKSSQYMNIGMEFELRKDDNIYKGELVAFNTSFVEIKLYDTKDLKENDELELNMIVAQVKDKLTLPIECILNSDEGNYVYLVKDNIVIKRNITTDIFDDKDIVITQNLDKTDRVIYKYDKDIKEGDRVVIKENDRHERDEMYDKNNN